MEKTPLDLYRLYALVQVMGGYLEVSDHPTSDQSHDELRTRPQSESFPDSSVNPGELFKVPTF